MTHEFDKDYWDRHWNDGPAAAAAHDGGSDPHPYFAREVADLAPSAALDAGAGTGAEALWLAARGWDVTAVDLSAQALARARERAAKRITTGAVRWVHADLTVWEPGRRFGLVTTSYAHPAMPQPAFYRRIAAWVAPGGTLLIVGHRRDPGPEPHPHSGTEPHRHPVEASATLADITEGLDPEEWRIETAEEPMRAVDRPDGRARFLRDVVVRATRPS
jgi:SAM-dependent methyltransferase